MAAPSPRGLLLAALVMFTLAAAATTLGLWLTTHGSPAPYPHAHLVPPVIVPGSR